MLNRAAKCLERYGAVLAILLFGPSVADACSMHCPSGLEMSDLSVHLDGEASVLQLQLNDYGQGEGAQRMERIRGFSLCTVL